jgi:hypothetical protein
MAVSQISTDGLSQLVRQLHRADIRSVITLMSKVIGDRNAATMFLRLLYWLPKSRKAGGWVYKSWRDWEAECHLSPAQVKRVHRVGYLERVGIESQTMKANGTPTTHYRLHPEQLVVVLAEYAGLPVAQVWQYLTGETMSDGGENRPMDMSENAQSEWSKTPNPMDENIQSERLEAPNRLVQENPMHSAKSAQSITSIPTLNSTKHYQHQPPQPTVVVVDEIPDQLAKRLVSIGLNAPRVQELCRQYGEQRLREVCDQMEGQRLTNPAGYLIRALRENWQWKGSAPVFDGFDGQAYVTGPYAAFMRF